MNQFMVKSLVKAILQKPHQYDWTLQGFGMLRMYLPGPRDYRLHIWDNNYRVKNVSDIHTHPWNFTSYVVAGVVENIRWIEKQIQYKEGVEGPGNYYWKQDIHCGTGGCIVGEPKRVVMSQGLRQTIYEGQDYHQQYIEKHQSFPETGTVTIVDRIVPPGQSVDMAYVYWPEKEQWVTAEPRIATHEEISDICNRSLEKWF
jgi:hypothetical protein